VFEQEEQLLASVRSRAARTWYICTMYCLIWRGKETWIIGKANEVGTNEMGHVWVG
jgi:hypothetical protein